MYNDRLVSCYLFGLTLFVYYLGNIVKYLLTTRRGAVVYNFRSILPVCLYVRLDLRNL